MMAASPLRAAGLDASVETSAGRKTVVVRADPRTGKLVRRVAEPAPRARKTVPPPPHIAEIVQEAAASHKVDPLLVHSIIQVESNYNTHAISPKGAEGLMQLMPPTARQLGVSNSFDPKQNIEAGVRYLKYLQDLYQDDRLALAAYNAGPSAVQKYNKVPPYPETQNYVSKVGQRYGEAKAAVASTPPGEPAERDRAAESAEPKHPRLEQFVDEHGRLHLKTAPAP
jgi:hypothetical protein